MQNRVLVISNDDDILGGLAPLLDRDDVVALRAHTLATAQGITASSRVDGVVLQAGFSGSLPGLHYIRWLRSLPMYCDTPVAVVIGQDELEEHERAAVEALGARVFRYPKELLATFDHVSTAIARRRAA